MEIEKEVNLKKFKDEWEKLSVNLIFTSGWTMGHLKNYYTKYGLTLQQNNILRILRGAHPEPLTTSVIRERMIDKMPDASRLVDRLYRKGLVNRVVSAKDRRLVDVSITEKALEILDELDSFYPDMVQIYQNLNEKEAATLNELLDKLRG